MNIFQKVKGIVVGFTPVNPIFSLKFLMKHPIAFRTLSISWKAYVVLDQIFTILWILELGFSLYERIQNHNMKKRVLQGA